MASYRKLKVIFVFVPLGFVSCHVEPYDEMEFFQTRVDLVTDFVEITDTSLYFHTELVGGYGQKINWVGHYWGKGILPPIPYFMDDLAYTSDSKTHDLRIVYSTDTIFTILPAVRFNDSIVYVGERIIVPTVERYSMKNYLK